MAAGKKQPAPPKPAKKKTPPSAKPSAADNPKNQPASFNIVGVAVEPNRVYLKPVDIGRRISR